MSDPQSVQRCRWAEPTLFQKPPLWTSAEDYPWSCKAEGEPRAVTDTLVCLTCGRWAARELVEQAPPVDARCHCGCGDGCTHR